MITAVLIRNLSIVKTGSAGLMNCPSLNKDKRGGLTSSGVFMTNDKLKSCSLSRLDHQIDQQNNILSIDLQLYFLKLTMT
ncbi:hypothetical protein, partial [Sphingobacterium multivorum]|uniref:hypothetical protein n=1 Tax=Sphingobacterium multivorum TaxID=28454 RepID=UPI0028B1865D